MPQSLADRFVEALGRLESQRDVDTIVSLFSDNAETGNVVVPEKFHGQDGVREFWTKYRETFGEMRSTFRNRFASESRAALEWSTEGTTVSGTPVHYDGVSILEMDGDKITRFRAYFDAGALGRQIESAAEKK